MKTIIIALCSLSLLASGTLPVNAKDAAEQEQYKVGQTLTLGDYTYTVTKFEPKRKIGSKYHNKEAEEGAKFMVFLLSQLQPGVTKRTATAFELPDDAFTGPLKLVIPEKGSLFKKKGNAVVELVKAGLAKTEPPTPKITEQQATSQAEQPEQEGEKPSPRAECHRSRKEGRYSLRSSACRSVVR